MKALVPDSSQSLRDSSGNNQSAGPEGAGWACPQVYAAARGAAEIGLVRGLVFCPSRPEPEFITEISTTKELQVFLLTFCFSIFYGSMIQRTNVFCI